MDGSLRILANAAPTTDLRICGDAAVEFDLHAAEGSATPRVKGFSMVAYTGGAIRPRNWPYRDPVVVDLEGMAVPRQSVPVDRDHRQEILIGHTVSIDKSQQRLKATGVLSGHHDTEQTPSAIATREVAHLAAGKFPWQSSIDATVHKLEYVESGQTAKVNGRNFQGPVYVARATTLNRISFVANGADGNSTASIAASFRGQSMNFEQWLLANGFGAEATLSDTQKLALQAAFKSATTPPSGPVPPPPVTPPAPNPVATMRADMAREANRIAAVRRVCSQWPGVEMEIDDPAQPGKKKKVGIEAHAIEAGLNENDAELHCRRNARPAGNHTAVGYIHGGLGSGQELRADAIEASLCLQANIPEARVAKWFTQEIMNLAVSAQLRACSIVTLMHETIRAAGMHCNPGRPTDDTIRVAIRADRAITAQRLQATAGFSTVSLSGILSNVANKTLINSYEVQNVVWPRFCAVRNHNDFKVHTRYRLDSTGSFRKVGQDGELKHIGLEDESYTNQLGTFGAIIALTRQMQINDDLGAFLEIPTILGRMAAIRIEELAFVLLLSNPSSFFHANNKNLVSGAGGAMTAANGLAAITAAEQKFSDQVDSNGKPVLLTPSFMLTGTANYVPARNIYEGRVKITGESATQVADNEHVGKYEPVKSPYVNNTAITDQDGAAISGQSSTKWWLFGDPSIRAAVAMAFLNGNRIPTIDSADTEFSTLGMQWRAYHDFGAGMEDPVAAVQVNGA